MKVLNWLAKQENLADFSKSMEIGRFGGGGEFNKSDALRHIFDSFVASVAEPWLAAHGELSR